MTEISFSPTQEPWSCKISIRRSSSVSNHEQLFGEPLSERANVGNTILRAYTAVIYSDPQLHAKASNPFPDINSSVLSTDVIRVDISGPGLADLVLVNTPDIIQDEVLRTSTIVDQLVGQYVCASPTSCLVLSVAPIEGETQGSELKLKLHAETKSQAGIGACRTPDLAKKLNAKGKHVLRIGTTFNPNRDTGPTYFNLKAEDGRWFCPKNEQLDAKDLCDYIGKQFYELYLEWLTDMMISTTAENSGLHFIESKPLIIRRITSFCDKIYQELCENSTRPGTFWLDYKATFDGFRISIQNTRPQFIPWAEQSVTGSSLSALECLGQGIPMSASTLRSFLLQHKARELPGGVPFGAKAALITAFQSTWPAHVETCLSSAREQLDRLISEVLEDLFNGGSALLRAHFLPVVLPDLS
ncbi:hypothetical protein HGRIS_014827 [Hohenbuehelia grisea]|uniref:Uncharacterized protein n=1 Tax=Hohenbuehelia grisea TaxID=104357 RepID=A0ABR3IQT4_9AGAR